MKTKVAVLTHDEANTEKRPFRIVGTVSGPYDGYVSVEYLDVYEYTNVHVSTNLIEHVAYASLVEHVANGWGVENTAMDNDGDWNYLLRRVKPENESADD